MQGRSRHLARVVAGAFLAAFLATACGSAARPSAPQAAAPAAAPAAAKPAGAAVAAPQDLVQPGRLTLGSDITYPPLEYFNSRHQPQGFDIRLGDALAKAMGLRAKWVDTRFAGLIPALRAGKLDAVLSGVTITAARAKLVDFIPYFSAGQAIVAKRSSHLHIASQDGLCGLKVAVEVGTVEAGEIAKAVEPHCRQTGETIAVRTYQTDIEAIHQVVAGTAQVDYTDSPVASYDVRKLPGLQVVSPVLHTANLGIVVRKGDQAMKTGLATALNKIEADGTLGRLLKQYGLTAAR